MANAPQHAGREAQEKFGWFYSHRFLLLRRLSQLFILMLFLSGPIWGLWILKGNYSSSLFLDTIPITDPLVMLQSLVTGYWPEFTVLLGAIIVLVFYSVVASRVFCSWVCPFNPIADLAAWLRRKLNIRTHITISRKLRYFILIAVLAGSAASGVLVWEWLNPVATLGRGIISSAGQAANFDSVWRLLVFGFGAGLWVLLTIFLLDLLVLKHGWCGHLCPIGALYSALGSKSVIHVAADKRDACNKCMDCVNICPEAHVLTKPVFGKQDSPLVLSSECTRCGRCIDVCSQKVFSIQTKFYQPGDQK
ncbi:quinol dehydrogenase ferredoxin subunit NapH [Saezia sanguinis]|uniref:quinol dehydrogenase ferredoxin subunit NapH n=1 Tax=Saezia sanguinis TaxID=1965230 RepID=UPI00302516DB